MFGSPNRSRDRLAAAIRTAIGDPPWLESVTVQDAGRAILVIRAEADAVQTAEGYRIEAENAAGRVPGISEVRSVLTSEKNPAAGRPTARKGPRLSEEALRQGAGEPSAGLRPIPGIARILVVASAKGGVGKSTFAVNLAAAMARTGMRVGLLDADIYGPSVPTMLGTLDTRPGTSPARKLIPVEAHGIQTLSIGYLSEADTPMIWRGPMVMSAIMQLLNDAEWGSAEAPLDLLIIDTPPGTGDAQLTIAQKIPVTAALIVTTPQEVALADVRRGVAMFARTQIPVIGIAETMSWFDDPAGNRHFLMGEGGGRRMAEKLGLGLIAEIPILQDIRAGGDEGRPAATLEGQAADLFMKLAHRVAIALDELVTRPPPEIVFED